MRGAVFYVRDAGSGLRVEVYSGGYLSFEPDRPPVRWTVADDPHPMLAWGGTLPEAFGGADTARRMATLRAARGG